MFFQRWLRLPWTDKSIDAHCIRVIGCEPATHHLESQITEKETAMPQAARRKPRQTRTGVVLIFAVSLCAVLGLLPRGDSTAQVSLTDHQIIMASFQPSDPCSILTGIDRNSSLLTAMLCSTTTFRASQLSKYQPGDPCKTLAASYNEVIASTLIDQSVLQITLTNMATMSCGARVSIDNTQVSRWFQPVPLS
jgi:hypothetical protein